MDHALQRIEFETLLADCAVKEGEGCSQAVLIAEAARKAREEGQPKTEPDWFVQLEPKHKALVRAACDREDIAIERFLDPNTGLVRLAKKWRDDPRLPNWPKRA